MRNNCLAEQSQGLDVADFGIAAIAIVFLHRLLKKQWGNLDKLYCERFYLEGRFAVLLHKQGRLTESDLQNAWADIDKRAGDYDSRCLNRFILSDYLQELARRLRLLARQPQEEARNAA